jgi:NADPH2:quinone reductase
MQKLAAGTMQEFKRRIAAELSTTFASHYTRQVSLPGMLSLENIAAYGRRATGEKYLVTPSNG